MSQASTSVGGGWRKRWVRALSALAVTGAAASFGTSAHAQQATFYLNRIQISSAPDDGFVVWRPYLHEKTRFYGAATLDYGLNPLRVADVTDLPNVQQRIETPMRHQLVTHLGVGAEFSGRFAIGFELPVTVYQGGGKDPQQEGVGTGIDRTPVALNDLRLNAKVLVHQSDDRKLRLGIGGAMFVPSGNSVAFGGDAGASGWLFGAGEYDFGQFQIAGNLGPHFRPKGSIHGDVGVLDVGSELRWTAGVFFPMRQGDVRLGGSLFGSTGIESGDRTGSTFFNSRNTDLEWLGEIKLLLDKKNNVFFNGGGGTRLSSGYGAPDIRLVAMIGAWTTLIDFGPGQVTKARRKPPDVEMHDKDTDGDGYPDDIDSCPTEKEDGKPPDPSDGCPGPKDRDGDGIVDDLDKCPDKPEDKDGIQDADGCPETDADSDGILDVDDACPLVAGKANKDPKKNGCPDEHKKIIETDGGIQLLEPIQFDTGRSTIKPVSFPVLDEVLDVLKSHPDARMAIYGHTDSHGSREMNTQLSKDRARAVLKHLVGKGIPAARLESDGFGPDKPLDTNDTDAGRAKNRRVEFKILGN